MPLDSLSHSSSAILTFAGWCLLVAAFLGGLSAVTTIVFLLKVKANFASKSDLDRTEANIRDAEARIMQSVAAQLTELGNQQRAVFARLQGVERSISAHSEEMARAVGKLEGAMEGLRERRD
jgi:biopolymer transport protein ExbB/TolQ